MLDDLELEFVSVVKGGSVYPLKGSGLGFAFSYMLGGKRQPRKVITGKTREELEEKAVRFLQGKNKDYIMEKEAEGKALEEACRPAVKTFSEVGEEWYAEYAGKMDALKNSIAFTSYRSRGYSLKKLNRYIGDVGIKDITNKVADDLIDRCSIKKDGSFYSRSAVEKDQQVFRMVMEYARKHGYCDNMVDKVGLMDGLTVVNKDERFIDKEKLKRILTVCRSNKKYYTLVKLLTFTGLRQEEAFALNIDDFKVLQNDLVLIAVNKTVVEEKDHKYKLCHRTKTRRSKREVCVPKVIYDIVMEYYNDCLEEEGEEGRLLRAENGTEGFIFVNKDKRFINKRTFERNFRDYLDKRGITGVCLHMFRHTYASLLAEHVPFDKVAMMLGDNPDTVYKNYYSLSRESKENISSNVNAIYGQFDF